jgi:hypothetical protein
MLLGAKGMRVLVKRFKLAVFGILPSASHNTHDARGGGSDNIMAGRTTS